VYFAEPERLVGPRTLNAFVSAVSDRFLFFYSLPFHSILLFRSYVQQQQQHSQASVQKAVVVVGCGYIFFFNNIFEEQKIDKVIQLHRVVPSQPASQPE
jgi:hypothetical protein